MEKFNSTYLGIVIQNNDPEYRGRCKIWVPHVSATIYEGLNKKKISHIISHPGKNLGNTLTEEMMNNLKSILPWAEYSSPIIGETGNGRYNSMDDLYSISDSNKYETTKQSSESVETETLKKYKLNSDGIGEKPARMYEPFDMRINDAFATTKESFSNKYNKFSYQYTPSSYSNCAKGCFSIPNVGSHLWVFFREGNPMYPVYFGASFSKDDWLSIFDPRTDGGEMSMPDYPATFENKNKSDSAKSDHNQETYRNKMVLNQKGASIEIVNTDNRESFKLTHYKGSFLEFNNRTGVLFLPDNFQRLVMEDDFDTINGYKNSFVKRDWDNIVQGDYYTKIGLMNYAAHNAWYLLAKAVNDVKKGLIVTSDDITAIINSNAKDFTASESSMGMGGNWIINIAKHKVENIGLKFNDLISYKIDTLTKDIIYKILVDSIDGSSVTNTNKIFPLVKYVHIDDFPGGNYTLNVSNKYNLIVGSGGINLKTTGHIDISGSIVNLVGQQVNIASPNNVNVDGGELISIVGNSVIIKHKDAARQIYLDKNVGIVNDLDVGNDTRIYHDAVVGNDARIARDELVGRDLTVEGSISVTGTGGSGNATIAGNTINQGNLTINGQFVANAINHTFQVISEPSGTHNGQTWTIKYNS